MNIIAQAVSIGKINECKQCMFTDPALHVVTSEEPIDAISPKKSLRKK